MLTILAVGDGGCAPGTGCVEVRLAPDTATAAECKDAVYAANGAVFVLKMTEFY